jgi:holo-[acyl-carrier protein] synthase
MILGIGVDIVSVEKMQSAVRRWGESFLNRIFHNEELAILQKNSLYYQRLAGRFAAKEAVIKSLGRRKILYFKDMVILNTPEGAPMCIIKEPGFEDVKVLISLTHIKEYAVATAVAQKKT